MTSLMNRRQWIAVAGVTAVTAREIQFTRAAEKEKDDDEREVPAVEDLMREHGILRRALLVYSEAAAHLAAGHADIPLAALGHTAVLFQDFGERYHEQALEEKHVFVPLIKAGGENAALARTLIAQHERGREITKYISAVAARGRLPAADVKPLSQVLVTFVRMYEHHAAIEDTIIFPAWKQAISPAEYRELSEQFEVLEHRMFGKDGFEDALTRIASIEREFGIANLDTLTAPAPPKLA